MVKLNYLDTRRADSLKAIPITLNYNRFANVGIAPYFREFIKAELNQWCLANSKGDGTPYNIYTDGLKIYTTIDSRMQIHAEAAVAEQMSQLQKQFYAHWGKVNPWQDNERVILDALRRTNAYKRLKEAEWSDDEIIAELSKPYDMRYFTWMAKVPSNQVHWIQLNIISSFLMPGSWLCLRQMVTLKLMWAGLIMISFSMIM